MMERLSLISAGPDRELDAIREIVLDFEDVCGLDDVISALQKRARSRRPIPILDAIGHSQSPGFLMLGSWLIDDSPQTVATFTLLLRPLLRQLGVRMIRLLGCATARAAPGSNVLANIARATGCMVAGTTRHISRRDYAPEGFAAEYSLRDTGAMRQ